MLCRDRESWINVSKLIFYLFFLSLKDCLFEMVLLCALSQRKKLKDLIKNKEIKKG